MSVLQRRAELLAELIQTTSGLGTPDHPRLTAVSRSCKELIDFHSFLDTVPNTVDQEFSLLRERLEHHAQFDKSKALSLLAVRLSNLDVGSTQLDFQHRVLSFLLASAHRVLDTGVDPTILASPEEGNGGEEIPDWSDDSGSEAEWWAAELPYSPGDALSQWSGDEGDDNLERDVFIGETPLLRGAENSGKGTQSDAFMSPRQLFSGSDRGPDPADAPLTPIAPPRKAHRSPRRGHGTTQRAVSPWRRQQQGKPYSATSLAVWLAAKDTGGHPARHLDPRRCFSQQELVLQVLNVLKGLNTPGLAFKYNIDTQTYSPRRGVHTQDMPPATTATLLQRFADLGTWLRHLQDFCDVILGGGGGNGASPFFNNSEEERKNVRSLPTIAALASAVSRQVLSIRGQLVAIEALAVTNIITREVASSTDGSAPTIGISLLSLRLQSAPLQRQVAALHSVVEQCRWQGDAAATACKVLNVLQTALEAHALDASSQGGVVAAMLAEIFAATCAPYLDALGAWVSTGALDRAPPEFFIRPATGGAGGGGSGGGNSSSGFWTDAFEVARLPDGSVAAPKLLQRHIEDLIAAGIAVRGLKEEGIDLIENDDASEGGDGGWSSLPEPPLSMVFYKAVCDVFAQRQLANIALAEQPLREAPGSFQVPLEDSLRGGSIETEDKGGVWAREWVATTARGSNGGNSGGIMLPQVEDLPDLPSLVSTALDLPAATAAAALWHQQHPSSDISSGPSKQERQRENCSAGSHPIGDAMRSTAAVRVEQFKAGRADTLIADLFTEAVEGIENGDMPVNGERRQQLQKQPAEHAVHDAVLDGRWSEWYTKVSSDLDGRDTFLLGGITTTTTTTAPAAKSSPSQLYTNSMTNIAGFTTGRGSFLNQPETTAAFPSDPAAWAAAPPLHSLLEQCLLAPLQARAYQAGADACAAVLHAGLLPQFAALRHVTAMALPSLEPFVRVLLYSASTSRGVDGLSSIELGASLQNALKDAGMDAQGVASAAIEIKHSAPTAVDARILSSTNTNSNSNSNSSQGTNACSVSAFSRLNISLKPALPLALVADKQFLESHCAITRLVLQLQWAEQSLRTARQIGWKRSSTAGGGGGDAASGIEGKHAPKQAIQAQHVLQHEMLHLSTAIHQHIATRLDAAGAVLEHRVAKCNSLAEVRERCSEFVKSIGQGCLIAPSGLAKELRELLIALLDCCLHHCILLRQEYVFSATAAAMSTSGGGGHEANITDGSDAARPEDPIAAAAAAAEADERLRQVRAALLAIRREWEKRRDAFMGALVREGGEVGAHSEDARALLAVVDPSSWYERRNAGYK